MLGGEPVAQGPSARIAIVEENGLVLGLATQAGYDAARAVVRRADAPPVIVLSLEHILESVYRSARTRQEDAA